jgi:hypothetical protein
MLVEDLKKERPKETHKEQPFQSDNEFAEVGRGKLNLLVDAQCARRRFVQASRLAQQRVPELDELDDIACESAAKASMLNSSRRPWRKATKSVQGSRSLVAAFTMYVPLHGDQG